MEDDVIILDDDVVGGPDAGGTAAAWKLMVVDDDPLVHDITRFALEDFRFEGRSLAFLGARSGAEAKAMIAEHPDVAVILLDVVMETDDAGLEVARYVREVLDNRFVRIILRTGQPGQAPERQVIVNYDINDYKAKSELTAQKLFTTVLAALRAYNQIAAIEMSRRGLEKILEASTTLYEQRSVAQFVDGVVMQIRSLINDTQGALLCAISGRHFDGDIDDVHVVAGVAPFTFQCGVPIRATLPEGICAEIAGVLAREESLFAPDHCVVFFKTMDHAASVIYLCGHRPLNILDRKLLEVFCSKVAIGFDNAYLFERILFEKTHDAVTGLLNRAAFIEVLDSLIEAAGTQELAVCLIDCDRFRDVNNALGYQAGDRLLQAVAERLSDLLAGGDVVGRLGGDQFVLLKTGPHAAIPDWADRLMMALGEPLVLDGCEIIPSVAAGIARVEWWRRADDHLADADRAMRRAKRLGGGRYEVAAGRGAPEGDGRLMLVTQLIHAIRRNQFELHYQPIVDSSSGALRGFEALIRWRHPDRGLLPPGAFIGVVEETGLIVPIGSWVLDQAVRQLVAWTDTCPGAERLHISVNVSARQFLNHDLVSEVERVLAATGLAPERLKLEVTESLIMTDPEHARRALAELRERGVRLSLDDFGTGYSSLSYLDRFAFDTLKIDRSFVASMLDRAETMAVVQAICMLALSLGLDIVGEGVERGEEAAALAALGCAYCQGFHFGAAVSADAIPALIRAADPVLAVA